MSLKLSLRDDVWYVVGRVTTASGGRLRVRKSTGYGKGMKPYAQETLSRILRDALDGKMDKGTTSSVTIDHAVDMYLKRPNPAGQTDQGVLRRFADRNGSMKLTNLGVADVMVYVNERGNKASTVCREINSIKAMLEYSRDMGLDVPTLRLKKPKVDDARCRWLTESERNALILASEPEITDMLTFLFYTGARLGEMFNLVWKGVVDNKAMLGTRKGASGKTRIRAVPLTAESLAAIGPRGTPNKTVFTTASDMMWTKDKFYPFFYRATDSVGIEDFRPHDCRHTFASHLVQKGASLRAVADLLGHSSLSMVMRYSHLAPSHLEDTVGLLGVSGAK